MNQRQQFAQTVTELMSIDPKIVILLADIGVHSFREAFEKYPDRCYNTGATEQATVLLAAGLAKSGLYPVVSTIASFLCRRAYEQIMVGFGINQLKGLFVSVGADGYPGLGPTHKCVEHMTLMEQIPDMWTGDPAGAEEADIAIRRAVEMKRLAYIGLGNN